MMKFNKKTLWKKRFKEWSLFFISIAIGIFTILWAMSENIIYFYTPSELSKANLYKKVRFGGLIKYNSIKRINDTKIEFIITDYKKDLKVFYQGNTPSLFKEGQGAVVTGVLSDNRGHLIATEVLAKHDENYMPREVAMAVKKGKNP